MSGEALSATFQLYLGRAAIGRNRSDVLTKKPAPDNGTGFFLWLVFVSFKQFRFFAVCRRSAAHRRNLPPAIEGQTNQMRSAALDDSCRLRRRIGDSNEGRACLRRAVGQEDSQDEQEIGSASACAKFDGGTQIIADHLGDEGLAPPLIEQIAFEQVLVFGGRPRSKQQLVRIEADILSTL